MSVDRPIKMDISISNRLNSESSGGLPSGSQQERDMPDEQLRQQFEQALAGKPVPEPAPAPAVRSPFDLFGAARTALSPSPPQEPPALFQQPLDEALSRLMVGEGGGGGQQVRMDLKDDLLPGVSMVLEHIHGRLQVDFICRVEASRLLLNRALPTQAPELAARLKCDVLMRVQTNNDQDPRLFEVAATA